MHEERQLSSLAEPPSPSLVLRLRGGAKKKKKKTYTKPKKNSHKHKKVPLAVLKYYKVDDEGKVSRTHMECPHPDCGAG
eukprot:gene41795-60362_t